VDLSAAAARSKCRCVSGGKPPPFGGVGCVADVPKVGRRARLNAWRRLARLGQFSDAIRAISAALRGTDATRDAGASGATSDASHQPTTLSNHMNAKRVQRTFPFGALARRLFGPGSAGVGGAFKPPGGA